MRAFQDSPFQDLLIILTILVLVAVPYFAGTVGVMNSMDGPQYALTRAIIERGTLSLDGYSWLGSDYAVVDGKTFSQRSPGISFLALPFYMYSYALTPYLLPPYLGKEALGVDSESPVEAVTYGLTGLIGALAVALFYVILRRLRVSRGASIWAALVLAFGSLLWCYSGSFVREPAVVLFLLGGYWAILRLEEQPRRRWAFIVGLSLGLAVMADNLAAVPVTVLICAALYFIWRHRFIAAGVVLLAGFGLGLLPLIAYNMQVFHRPFVVQYMYAYNELFHEPRLQFLADPLWSIPVNLLSIGKIPSQALPYIEQEPELAKAVSAPYAILTPYKGILIESPILILGLLYTLAKLRWKRHYLLPLLVSASVILLISKSSYFYNPNNYDIRYFLPAVAFLFIPLGACLDALLNYRNKLVRIAIVCLVVGLTLISIFNGWEAVLQNYPPHLSGHTRSSAVNVLFGDAMMPRKPFMNTTVTRGNAAELLIETFPNYANIPYLLPVLLVMLLIIITPQLRTLRAPGSQSRVTRR